MLKLCGETQDKLAQELILFELTIERDVIEPLYDLSEVRGSRSALVLTEIYIVTLRLYLLKTHLSSHQISYSVFLLCLYGRNNSLFFLFESIVCKIKKKKR